MHTKIKTKTVPRTLTILEASALSNRNTSQIHYAIGKNLIDYGYIFSEPDLLTRGQKVIIDNPKWEKWLTQRARNEEIRDGRMLKEAKELRENGSGA